MSIWKYDSIQKSEGNLGGYVKFMHLTRAKHRDNVHNDIKGNIWY